MSRYTEQQISELSGRELRVAVHRLVLGDDLSANTDERIGLAVCEMHNRTDLSLTWAIGHWKRRQALHFNGAIKNLKDLEQHVANWRAEPLPMPLEWCIEKFYGPEGILRSRMNGHSWTGYEMRQSAGDLSWSIVKATASPYATDRHESIACHVPDLRTALQLAACIVALRERE